jgi:hypothetical protein
MTDVTPESPARKPKKNEVIEDAVVVDDVAPGPVVVEETVVEEPVVEEPAKAEPIVVDSQPQVVYVQTPQAPRKRGNRGVGALIAVGSGVVFAAALALATSTIGFFGTGRFSFGFLATANFYIPTLFFIIGFVLLVLIANRAAWWAYIFGSILVGLIVYFGTIGLGLLSAGVILKTPDEAAAMYAALVTNPFVIVSALLAREVSLWFGSLISRRGRSVRVRNAEARAAHEAELAERRGEGERASAAASNAY